MLHLLNYTSAGVPCGVFTWVALRTEPVFMLLPAQRCWDVAAGRGWGWLQCGAQPQLFLLQPHHPWAQQHLLLTVTCTNTHLGKALQQQVQFRAATNAWCENSLSLA